MTRIFAWTPRMLCAAAAGLATTLTACAQQIPNRESGDPTMITRVVNGQIEMVDARNGAIVMAAQGIPLFEAKPNVQNAEAKYEVHSQPDGFDVVYRLTARSGGEAVEMGRLRLGVFNLGKQVTYRDFRYTGDTVNADYSTYVAPGNVYPGTLYSPVSVVSNGTYSIGVSMQYPVLEYGHDVRMMLHSPGGRHANGPAGRGWAMEYRLSNFGDESGVSKMFFPGSMKPGESRTYVLSVRVTTQHDEWQRTLLPYRSFFQKAYGPVRYARDNRPVNAVVLAANENVTETNPLGFGQSNGRRPDLVGWQPVIADLAKRDQWPRMMIWMAGGNYQYTRDDSFHFARRWFTNPKLAEAVDPSKGFPALVRQSNVELGLWWSQSILYNRSRGDLVGFDRTSSRHVDDALAELEAAAQAGATMIGLDTFHNRTIQVANHYRWLERMTQQYPNTTFVTEPITNDITHTLSPTFLQCWGRTNPPKSEAELHPIKTPHYLADFINPGHEIWGTMRYQEYRQFFGKLPDEATVRADMQQIASFGYVPAIFTAYNIAPSQEFLAAETWKVTVPADLRQDAGKGQQGDDGRGSGDSSVASGVEAPNSSGDSGSGGVVAGSKAPRQINVGRVNSKVMTAVSPSRLEVRRAIERMSVRANTSAKPVETAGVTPADAVGDR